MSETLAELTKLPAVGTIIGATIAFTGVFATLLAQYWNRRKEREHALRREVYLKAAEAIAQQTHMLASMGNLSLTPGDLARLSQGNPGWMNKVHMFASLETIASLNALNEFTASNTVELIEQRLAIDDLNRQIEGHQRELGLLSDHQRQASAALQALTQQPSTPENQARFGWLVEELKRSKPRGEELNQHLGTLLEQRQQHHRNLLEGAVGAAIDAQSLLVAANLAIRGELGLKINKTKYSDIVRGSGIRMLTRFKGLLDRLGA